MKAQAAETNLPEYDNPPVTEVVCGVLFKPLERFRVAHFGLFWEQCKAEYPRCLDVAPLLPAIEAFAPQREASSIELPDMPLPRVWFVNDEETGIIQLQRDRFLHNWKKAKPSDSYPRYRTVIAQFKRYLERFETFVIENELGGIEPLQYEMTYVNHITAGWNDISELGRVFRHHEYRVAASDFLPMVETANLKTTFALPSQSGRLHASIKNAIRKEDSKPVIVFELTVRGVPTSRPREDMADWFDLAHEWIVRGFTDLTTDAIQNAVWRRTR